MLSRLDGAAGPRSAAAPPRPFAELVLLDLAGRRLRQLAELDLARRLEAGQRLAREGDQLLGGQLGARPQGHEALRPLAPLLVRDGDDCGLENVRVPHERALDLDRGDVLAARDDDVLGTVANLDVAV